MARFPLALYAHQSYPVIADLVKAHFIVWMHLADLWEQCPVFELVVTYPLDATETSEPRLTRTRNGHIRVHITHRTDRALLIATLINHTLDTLCPEAPSYDPKTHGNMWLPWLKNTFEKYG